MPSADTFSVKPIGDFVRRYLAESKASVDPFARTMTRYASRRGAFPDESTPYRPSTLLAVLLRRFRLLRRRQLAQRDSVRIFVHAIDVRVVADDRLRDGETGRVHADRLFTFSLQYKSITQR